MNFPESVTAIVQAAAKRHPSDISAATDEAERRIRKLPEFEELVGMLLRNSIQELVYDARHTANVQTKRDAGYYGQGSKVGQTSTSVNRVYESTYNYYIAGTILGEVVGKDLASIAESEREKSDGHLFNACLCEELGAVVPNDKRVREAVPEKKLQVIFNRLRKKYRAA